MTNETILKQGQRVRFSVENFEGENDIPMFVVEDRDTRVLVVSQIDTMTLQPTAVYLKSELEIVS